jgi:predicted O-methyltransferase YrrM
MDPTKELPDLRIHADYIRQTFAPEDGVLRALASEADREGLPDIRISADVGRLLQVLARAVGARRALEIGTLGGYSAIWMARALPPDGKLVTIESRPEHALFARRWIDRAGLVKVVEVRTGEALDVLPTLVRGKPFDLAFIDADKESYPEYLDWCLRLVRPGGIIAADNVLHASGWSASVSDLHPADRSVRAIQEFNRKMASSPRLTSVAIPIREGVAVAVVEPEK